MLVTYNLKLVWLDEAGEQQFRQVLISADFAASISAVASQAADIIIAQSNDSPGMAGGIDVVSLVEVTGVSEGHREGAYTYEGE